MVSNRRRTRRGAKVQAQSTRNPCHFSLSFNTTMPRTATPRKGIDDDRRIEPFRWCTDFSPPFKGSLTYLTSASMTSSVGINADPTCSICSTSAEVTTEAVEFRCDTTVQPHVSKLRDVRTCRRSIILARPGTGRLGVGGIPGTRVWVKRTLV